MPYIYLYGVIINDLIYLIYKLSVDTTKIDKLYSAMDETLLSLMGDMTFEEIDCVMNRIQAKILHGKIEAFLSIKSEDAAKSTNMYG